MTETPLALIDRDAAKLDAIAPGGYLLALRIRGTAPLQAYKTYPQAWIDEYTQNGYMLRDPLLTWAMTVGGTIRWSSAFLPDPFGIFRKAAKHGLNFGASVACGPLSSLTICSMGRGDREFTDDEIAAAKAVVFALHEAAQLPARLTGEDRRILDAVAAGQKGGAIAKSLDLPAEEARARVEALCGLLLARTPEEALRHAKDAKLH